jgi:hypothetical protein
MYRESHTIGVVLSLLTLIIIGILALDPAPSSAASQLLPVAQVPTPTAAGGASPTAGAVSTPDVPTATPTAGASTPPSTPATQSASLTFVIDILKIIASWPVIVALILYSFREPIAKLIDAIGKRATKVSVFQFSVELPPAAGPPPIWSEAQLIEFLKSPARGGSALETLKNQFADPSHFNHIVIDLGDGKTWLNSRLYLFAVMLKQMNGLQCFLFLHTKNNVQEQFLGIATADEVRWALANRYPWLEVAFARAYATAFTDTPQDMPRASTHWDPLTGRLDVNIASKIASTFLGNLQLPVVLSPNAESEPQLPLGKEPGEWVFLRPQRTGDPTVWERAVWLDAGVLKRILGKALQEQAYIIDSPDLPKIKRNKQIVRRSAHFVALLNTDKAFENKLVDRDAFIEKVAQIAAEPTDEE